VWIYCRVQLMKSSVQKTKKCFIGQSELKQEWTWTAFKWNTSSIVAKSDPHLWVKVLDAWNIGNSPNSLQPHSLRTLAFVSSATASQWGMKSSLASQPSMERIIRLCNTAIWKDVHPIFRVMDSYPIDSHMHSSRLTSDGTSYTETINNSTEKPSVDSVGS